MDTNLEEQELENNKASEVKRLREPKTMPIVLTFETSKPPVRWPDCYIRQCHYLMLNYVDCLGDQCHVYSILCALQYTTACLSGSLVFATDAELYKNMTYIVYNYDTLL